MEKEKRYHFYDTVYFITRLLAKNFLGPAYASSWNRSEMHEKRRNCSIFMESSLHGLIYSVSFKFNFFDNKTLKLFQALTYASSENRCENACKRRNLTNFYGFFLYISMYVTHHTSQRRLYHRPRISYEIINILWPHESLNFVGQNYSPKH